MVGVPGRSKGCNTCRKRKKGCDLQRPSCGQCQKAGIDCAGYERKRIFVNVTHPVANSNSKVVVPIVRTIVQTPSLSQSAFEDKVFDLFWEGYMPEAPLCIPGSPIVRYSNADWATTVRDLFRTDIALRQSLLAFSLGTIGRRDKQQWMIDDGLKFYCEALSELNVALRHPKRWKTDALMLASRILGFYEIITHIKRRRRCPLSHPVWKTVPWQNIPKTPKDVLVDIFVDVPGLLEDLDHLRSCKDSFEKELRRMELIKECWRIDEELNWWLDNLSPKRELEELMARGLDNPSACDVVVASIMSLCWTISLLSYSTLRLAIGEKTGLELPKRTDPSIYCTKIANIVDIFFHPSAGTFGIQSAPLPIGMALVYLNSFEEGFNSETKWKLVGFFGRTANNGIGIGKFLLSTQRDGLASKATTPVTPDGIKTKAKGWMGTAA
ncbi:C6 zinc finger domain-containing protein [Colletotrichum incanum]|nr:C6 zinc finger domain-containing protein [Colletotrichum incanum]